MSIKVDGDIPTEFVIDEIARTTAIVLGENAALKEENKRLRGYLERILVASEHYANHGESESQVIYAHESTARLAREALKEE